MKRLIKIIFTMLILNCYAYSDVKIKIDYDSFSFNPLLSNPIKNEIITPLEDLNYDKQKFYLTIQCYVSSNGIFRYRLINESQSGYDDKILIVEELEKQKNIDFENYMKMMKAGETNSEYKEFTFIFKVINE